MLNRAIAVLLLLFLAAGCAQENLPQNTNKPVRSEIETAISAIVRISGMRGGTPVRGSGFVIGLDPDKATIVTASHVIAGAQQIEVSFAAEPGQSFPADVVLGMDAGNPNGLAAFLVRGALPAGITVLTFGVESPPRHGDELFLVGFPEMTLTPLTPRRALSGRRGTLLMIDQAVGEGFSGGPVLQGDKVVGVVTESDEGTTYAVTALVAREALDGWGVMTCRSGEERTMNGITFVRICPGTFMMGSAEGDPHADVNEKPAHPVTLSEFWIAKTEITIEQYARVGSIFGPVFGSVLSGNVVENRLPMTGVSWDDAKSACESFGGRLPAEAEWEYAARAGNQTAWSHGDDEGLLGDYAWYEKNSGNTLHPVGMKKPNAWGLHDMHGNAEEWVAGWFAFYPSVAQADPSGSIEGKERLLRGGSFASEARLLRSASRKRFPIMSEIVRDSIAVRLAISPFTLGAGFRCVLEIVP